LNVAIGNAPDDDIQLMFVNLIDAMTPWHIRILKFFQDPEGLGRQKGMTPDAIRMGAPATLLERFYPDLGGQREFYDLIIKELYSGGLFSLDSLHTTMTAQGMFERRTTRLGDAFFSFVTSPI